MKHPDTEVTKSPVVRRQGRPTKRTSEIDGAILSAVRLGVPAKFAARMSRVDPVTLYRWRRRDAELDERVQAARAAFLAENVGRVHAAGKKDWRAAQWLLQTGDRENFGQRARIEVSGPRAVVDPLSGETLGPTVARRLAGDTEDPSNDGPAREASTGGDSW